MNDYSDYGRRRLYRSKTDYWFLGVCGGFAQYLDFPAGPLRFLVGFLVLSSGVFPGLVVYIVMGLFMKPEPVGLRSEPDDDFYRTAQKSPGVALDRIQTRFDQLDKRLQKMEDIVTSDRTNLEEEFRKLQRGA